MRSFPFRGRGKKNLLLPHLERFLGQYRGEGFVEREWNVPFSALRWRDTPAAGVDVTATLGLGRHVLDGRRQEVLMALRSEWEDVVLSMVVSVGAYVVDRHAPLNLGETVRIPHELKTPTEKVVVASADDLVTGLGLCANYDPPIEILWLVPQTRDRFTLTSV